MIEYVVNVWELRKVGLFGKNLSVPQSQCQNELGDMGLVVG